MNAPPLIAWDVDDVLNGLTREWHEEFRQGRAALPYEELAANPPDELLSISRDEFLRSMDSFRARRMAALKPSPATLRWFLKSGDAYRHFALSAVPMKLAHLSAEWTVAKFGRWLRGFSFVPSPRPDDAYARHELNKGDMLAMTLHADLFIDDSEQNVADAERLGVRSLLFPAPWNRNRDLSPEAFLDGLDETLKSIGAGI